MTRVLAICRWVGISFAGLAGIVTPLQRSGPLFFFIFWAAVYNGWLTYANHRAKDESVVDLGRIALLLDTVGYFIALGIFVGSPAEASIRYGCYVLILIEAFAYFGSAAALVSALVFVAGSMVFEAAQVIVFGHPFAGSDLLLSSVVTLVVGAALAAVDRVLLVPALATNAAVPKASSPDPPIVRISPRELEVLRLVAQGCSNPMIASRLHLSENTVKTYVEFLLNRLGARNRAEAVAAASRLQLL